jgi:hypothetical protein
MYLDTVSQMARMSRCFNIRGFIFVFPKTIVS